ncbi:hypothetical protein Y032_0001g251 [Ancylostoma ceylanicum]|uniref:SWIM-type domain-containing protein n=2 Tax=Ancylostoma ceylanicum TaxID=53326 RepID=A0A016W554_9BILA|nr:hypothetical protein Y032_0001g251 [Ancylostoma ceylanicum]
MNMPRKPRFATAATIQSWTHPEVTYRSNHCSGDRHRVAAVITMCGERRCRPRDNVRRHERAVEEGVVEMRRDGPDNWIIESFTDPRTHYRITVVECLCRDTRKQCPLCGVCAECVTCSCPDAAKCERMSCKHAHAWALYHDEFADLADGGSDDDDIDSDFDLSGSEVDSEEEREVEKRLVATVQDYMDRIALSLNVRRPTGARDRIDELMIMESMLWDLLVLETGEEPMQRSVPQHRPTKRSQVALMKKGNGREEPLNKMPKRSEDDSPLEFKTGAVITLDD